MSMIERWKSCVEQARSIVAAQRAGAPEGCDPVASWVAVGVAVVGTAYSAYKANQTVDAAKDNAAAIFGTKPKVADFVPVDLGAEQSKALASNQGNADDIVSMLDKFVPGFSDILKQGLGTSASLMRGEIPQDVQDQVKRSDAFQSLMGGFAGTGMSKALTARDFGRTSLDLQQAGANSAQLWTKLAESSYSPWMVTTAEEASQTAANNAGAQATQQYQYNVDAAADPSKLGLFNLQTAQNQQQQSQVSSIAGLLAGLGSTQLSGVGSSGAGGAAPGGNTTIYNGTLAPVGNYGGGGTPGFAYNPSTGQYGQVSGAATDWMSNAGG